MVAWYWLIVAFFSGLILATFALFWWDAVENMVTDFLAGLCLIVFFIPMWLYILFFKNTIIAVPVARWESITNDADFMRGSKFYHLFGNLYFWRDKKASVFWKKWFFVRVEKKPIDK